MSPARNVAAALLFILASSCGKAPVSCPETLTAKTEAIQALGTFPTNDEIVSVLGDPSGVQPATGGNVQKYGESGCSDIVAVLYPHSIGFMVVIGRESSDWSKFPGVGDALSKM